MNVRLSPHNVIIIKKTHAISVSYDISHIKYVHQVWVYFLFEIWKIKIQ